MEKLKLSDTPGLIERVEKEINSGNIVELKRERGKDGDPVIALVLIKRTLLIPSK